MKAIIIIIQENWIEILCGCLAILLIVFGITSYNDYKLNKKIEKNDFAYVRDLREIQRDRNLSYKVEKEWVDSHYPGIYTSNDHTGGFASSRSYDSSFVYSKSLSFSSFFYDRDSYSSANYKKFLVVDINENYRTFECTSFISKTQMELWEKNNAHFKYPGFCIIFGDGEVLYISKELTPTGQVSEKISVDVEGVYKLVICVIGQIYLGEPYVENKNNTKVK